MEEILIRADVGRIALSDCSMPYIVPVNFVYDKGALTLQVQWLMRVCRGGHFPFFSIFPLKKKSPTENCKTTPISQTIDPINGWFKDAIRKTPRRTGIQVRRPNFLINVTVSPARTSA
jgi:hypothetical protein